MEEWRACLWQEVRGRSCVVAQHGVQSEDELLGRVLSRVLVLLDRLAKQRRPSRLLLPFREQAAVGQYVYPRFEGHAMVFSDPSGVAHVPPLVGHASHEEIEASVLTSVGRHHLRVRSGRSLAVRARRSDEVLD